MYFEPVSAFGMTESGPTSVPEWDDDHSNGSVGIVACNTEYKVRVCKVDLVLNNKDRYMEKVTIHIILDDSRAEAITNDMCGYT